ncbi:putative Mediator of RNA polymerase II transcription subunit 31 [Drepanopeziza brunnea f. sp. 'multigermtubi' MB_m1]|uniref:Mediator of RNA polymerase II transcription subunit 31 n=1 Tax=Marssonina brunnea f. sp. multigermtubi (strain MB_m1) TaxID=1072389 RepID=K1WHI3_MARBU|nr:putative Mediator of RNA polymerase II transcription subunit 31 [Drepanopeziza brunnea f. sp. 'multigermtubi' MB_m1]EKD12296.1 putative Mediator of RNA polymerase II transcription subunit 31 [Drepanopeziza brunnea f. sp. 'multigermtubi' MB_m1]
MSGSASPDKMEGINIGSNPTPPPLPPDEPKYGGFTRFEIELEFIQSLASPLYLNHLASQKYLENPDFIAYLSYLQYWANPPYSKYINYPGPTLKNLELLQQEQFRKDILSPETVARLFEEGARSALARPGN